MPQKDSNRRDGSSTSKITDPRFRNFEYDSRYALPSKRATKVKIDKRFGKVLRDPEFIAGAKVDRYGRELKSDHKKKALQRLYEEEEEDQDDEEAEDDEALQRLEKADAKYDPARGEGFLSSDSEAESDEEQDDAADSVVGGEHSAVETGEITRRLAVVNLNWDAVNSVDLMALFSSFVPPSGGRVEKVSIYPSEFGKARMAREDVEGPPQEIFKKRPPVDEHDTDDTSESDESEEDSSDDEKVKRNLIKEGDDRDFDPERLRSYQLQRLRYFYAVVTCSDKSVAQAIYEATDGTEYQASGIVIDLSFIPDELAFDNEPRDSCDEVPSSYKPNEVVADALAHSKVRLTWDVHPEEVSRKESIKRAFTGSRADIFENDLRAYLGSDSDSEEDQDVSAEDAKEPQLSKKELARQKMRAALGLSDEPAPKSSKRGPVGDMQITFSSALSEKPTKGKTDVVEETTVEKYMRKEKERKEKRRQSAKAERLGLESDVQDEPQVDLGFDDPFFTLEEPSKSSKSTIRKEERQKKREAREAEAEKKAAEMAQLELLMADNTNEEAPHLDHFDMNEIVRAEKKKNKKHKKGKKGKPERGGLQDDFDPDIKDPRFSAIFDDHQFAIDPSNPKFKKTPVMQKVLEEGRRMKRKGVTEDDYTGSGQGNDVKKVKLRQGELATLVDSVKRKSRSN